jgi:hypothetical protein
MANVIIKRQAGPAVNRTLSPIVIGRASVTAGQSAAISLNTAHRTSSGTDHSYIDQSVVSGASPTFNAANITGLPIAGGGTGQATAQTAINALTSVSGATDEYILTKDTATGNAIFKANSGGGGGLETVLATRDLTSWGSGSIIEDISVLDPSQEYDYLIFRFDKAVYSAAATLYLEQSADDQSSWTATFFGGYVEIYNNKAISSGNWATPAPILNWLSASANSTISGDVKAFALYGPRAGYECIITNVDAGSNPGWRQSGGLGWTTVTDLRFRLSSGNFTGGSFYVIGVKHA